MSSKSEQNEENPTEFVMKKNGTHVEMWAVVNGVQVFQASPPATAAGEVIQAAVKTWITRAWEREFNEMLDDQDDSREGWFR